MYCTHLQTHKYTHLVPFSVTTSPAFTCSLWTASLQVGFPPTRSGSAVYRKRLSLLPPVWLKERLSFSVCFFVRCNFFLFHYILQQIIQSRGCQSFDRANLEGSQCWWKSVVFFFFALLSQSRAKSLSLNGFLRLAISRAPMKLVFVRASLDFDIICCTAEPFFSSSKLVRSWSINLLLFFMICNIMWLMFKSLRVALNFLQIRRIILFDPRGTKKYVFVH